MMMNVLRSAKHDGKVRVHGKRVLAFVSLRDRLVTDEQELKDHACHNEYIQATSIANIALRLLCNH